MEHAILEVEGGVVLLGGGAVAAADVHAALTIAPILVAADGGGDRALAMGLRPEVVIGDMDSLSPEGRVALAGRIHEIPEQDSTDFGKCLAHVRAGFYLGLGFTGLRLDHTLATLAYVAARPDLRVILLAEEEVIFRAPARLALDLPVGMRFSLFPFGAASGRSEGLRWPIAGIGFTPAGRVGTSNEVSGPVRLEIEGPMLVMVPRAALGAVLTALGSGSGAGSGAA